MMTAEFFWRLPTRGDVGPGIGRLYDGGSRVDNEGAQATQGQLATVDRGGFAYADYLARVAHAADMTGFDGLIVPPGPDGEEPLAITGALARETSRVRFLPSFHSNIAKPVHLARQTATLQRHSRGRIDWNLLAGENDRFQRRQGDFSTLAERLERNAEFVTVVRKALSQQGFDYSGTYFQVEKGGVEPPLVPVVLPRVFLSGISEQALDVVARQADVYVSRLLPPEILAPRLDDLRRRSARVGRTLRFALRADILLRHSDQEARDAAQNHHESRVDNPADWRNATDEEIDGLADEQAFVKTYAQRRHFEDSLLTPDLWVTHGLTRQSASLVLLGSGATVARQLDRYAALGVDIFILASAPHVEEAYRTAEALLPAFASSSPPT